MEILYSILLRSIISPLAICISTFTAFNFVPLITKQPIPATCFSGDFRCLSKTTEVEMITNKGKITIALFYKAAPLTTGNFIALVKRGSYNGIPFHRVIREFKPLFIEIDKADMAHCSQVRPYGEFMNPGMRSSYQIPIEIALDGKHEPLYGKYINSIENMSKMRNIHDRGALAMVRSSNLGVLSSQFRIILRPLSELDGRYTVFGQISEGINIADSIEEGDKIIEARVL